MILLFALTAVMLEDAVSSPEYEIVIVMLLLFALTAVIKFIIASRGCTSDKVLARMFIIVPLIAIGFWPCILVIEFIFASTDVMLADVSLDGGSMMVVPLLFATTAVMIEDNASGQKFVSVMLLLFA